MDANEKRLAAALAAVASYIQTEEEALVMPAPKRPEPRRFDQGNLWSLAGRQCKIITTLASVQTIHEGDDIFLINLIEERDVSAGSLPIGNISANELDIRIVNKDRLYDAGNENSPFRNC